MGSLMRVMTVFLLCIAFLSAQETPKRPPPLPITILGTSANALPRDPQLNEFMASARFSDEFIAIGKAKYHTDASQVRIALICTDNHPECIPLRPGQTYWVTPIYQSDPGYAYGYMKECNPFGFHGTISGEDRLVVYALCILPSKQTK
jgi:hypothetical protein